MNPPSSPGRRPRHALRALALLWLLLLAGWLLSTEAQACVRGTVVPFSQALVATEQS